MPRARASTRSKPAATTTRTFLFSDLRDYTSYVEAKGDAAAARLLREYRTLVRREVARHDGAEVKTEGDSFYVVFAGPSSALECAVAILRAAETLSERDPTTPLRIGVGLHAGETVEYDDQYVGSAVNIASRLAGKAAAMELLISDTLRGLVRTSQKLQMTDRGAIELKGVSERIRAWSVEWREARPQAVSRPAIPTSPPPPAAAAGQLLCPVVVGRTDEAARFAGALEATIAGSGQTVVVGGEAGVGKSRFVREAQGRAVDAGMRVLVGITHQSDGALPYAPFVSAVRSGFRGLDRDELGRVLQRSAPDLAELFPELGRIERSATPTSLERHRLTVAFQHLFRAFAREAPVLVVLEDLHWADETSLELLQHLARELRDARVLILATYRSDEMHRRHPFLRTLAELQRERLVTEVLLKRLTPDETRELIRATMGTRDPNVRVSDEFRDALYARSEGNPFFTEELLKALVESGGVYWSSGTGWQRKPIDELEIPGSIRETVRARVEELPEEARATLSAAAAIGQRFPFALLAAVTGVAEDALESQLRSFVELQLVAESEDADDEFAFRHALTREVVYDDLLVRERKRLHRRVADALDRDPNAEPALLAHHLLVAGEGERALPHLLAAAERASTAGAPREAVAHLERALEIGVPEAETASVLERLAEAYHLFDEARSLKAANEAADLYRQRSDRRGLSRMLRLASRTHWTKGDGEPAARDAQAAVDAVADDDSVELARALAHVAGLRMTAGDADEAIAYGDRAIAMAERFDDAFALSNALVSKGSALARRDPQAGVALIDRGRRIAMDHGLSVTATRAMNNMALWLNVAGLRTTAEQMAFVQDALQWASAHGVESASAWLRNMRAWMLSDAGRFDEAIADFEWITARGLLVGSGVHELLVVAREGPSVALSHVADLVRHGERMGEAQAFVPQMLTAALIHALEGRAADANAVVDRVRDRAGRDVGVRGVASGPWHAMALTLGVLLGRDELIDLVAAGEEGPTPQLRERRAAYVAAARAMRRGDAAAAGRELGRGIELSRASVGLAVDVWLVIAGCRVLGPSVAAVAEWRMPLQTARDLAAKARAAWWLEVIPEPVS